MPEIQLGYGRDSISFAFDDSRFTVLSRDSQPARPLTDVEIGEAIDTPVAGPTLDELCSAGTSVLIVVSDATRATGSAQVVNILVRRIISYGVSPVDIAIIFATGIHRPVTPKEKAELLTPFIMQRVRVIDHDAYDATQMISFGATALGTPVELNRALKDYSLIITTGAVGFHYFAGFTGGRKSICPGLASARTIETTHMLALDFQTGERREGVQTARLSGNAFHEECELIAALISPLFNITTQVDERGRAVKLYSGDCRASHELACSNYLRNNSAPIDHERDLVIVSCGGFPYDINLVQAHKALDMAVKACRDGGNIVLLAECSEGLGRPDFLKWFAEQDSRSLGNRLRESYEVNGQTAWALLAKAERYRVYLISGLPEDEVRLMRMTPAGSPQEVLSLLPEIPGYIMPRGAAVLPQLYTAVAHKI